MPKRTQAKDPHSATRLIAGWVRMSRNHVFHGGPKYAIFTISYRSVPRLIIHFQIGDTSLSCGEMDEKYWKITKFGTNFDPPPQMYLEGAHKILKPVSDTPFQGLLLGIVWTMPRP